MIHRLFVDLQPIWLPHVFEVVAALFIWAIGMTLIRMDDK